MELLDIVDENNIPTGESKPRSLVHTDGDWHRVVHVYFVGPDGRLLVHLRSLKKDLHPGRWDTRFGGHVPSGMGVDEAVLKELGEEVGIAAEPERLIRGQIKKHDGTTNREFVYVFFSRFAGDIGDLSFDDGEVTEVRWMKPEQIIADIEAQPEKWASTREGFSGILRQISGIISESSSV